MKRADPHRWLVSYADFMTLLCVFFIMLYAVQLIDEEEGAAIREELEGLFTTALPPVPLTPPTLSTEAANTQRWQDPGVRLPSKH